MGHPLASFLFNCAIVGAIIGVRAEILLFLGLMQKYYCPELLQHTFLCRAFFRGCAEILIFGEIFTSNWAPKLSGLLSCLGSRDVWAPELSGLPSCLGSRVVWAPISSLRHLVS